MPKVSLFATRPQLLGMVACGMLGGLIIFMGGVGVGMHPTETNGRLVGELTPQTAPIAAPITKYLPQATKTIQLPAATKTITIKVPGATITKVAPRKELVCAGGATEDSCYPDYIGKGRWVLKAGDRPAPQVKSMPKATKKVPGATIAGVCRHPSITKGMVADCNKLASRPAETKEGYSNPKGSVLVQECTEQYRGEELATCLR